MYVYVYIYILYNICFYIKGSYILAIVIEHMLSGMIIQLLIQSGERVDMTDIIP